MLWPILVLLLILVYASYKNTPLPFALFQVWRARIYQLSPTYRGALIDPFNWIILNDTKTGQILVFGSQVYRCAVGTMPYYIFGSDATFYQVKCWNGNYDSLLAQFSGPYQTVELEPAVEGKPYCVLNAINNLLDRGVFKN